MTKFEELKAISSGAMVPPGDVPAPLTPAGTDTAAVLLKFITAFMAYIECPSWNYIKSNSKTDFSKEPVSQEPHLYEKEGSIECIVTTANSATKYRARSIDVGNGRQCIVVDAGFKVFAIVYEEDIDESMESLYQAWRRAYQRGAAAKSAKTSEVGSR